MENDWGDSVSQVLCNANRRLSWLHYHTNLLRASVVRIMSDPYLAALAVAEMRLPHRLAIAATRHGRFLWDL